MSTNRYEVEGIMDEMELKYFSRENESGCSWILMFGDGGVLVRLVENGEFLLIRSFPLDKVKRLSTDQRCNLSRMLLKRNSGLKLGRYSVDDEVVFETGLPIEDSELTGNQFKRCLVCVTTEFEFYESAFEAFCQGIEPDGDTMDQLMHRLFDGPSDSSEQPAVEPYATTDTRLTADAPEAESGFGVVLRSFAQSKLDVVKVVKQLTGLSLLDSKRLVESAPAVVGRWETREQAAEALRQLVDAGALAAIE